MVRTAYTYSYAICIFIFFPECNLLSIFTAIISINDFILRYIVLYYISRKNDRPL